MTRVINTLQSEGYGNWEVYHQTGKLMFRCSEKRARWYLIRNLAVITDDKTIQLTFETAGLGDDPEHLLKRENICVACAAKDDLTKHHIVPYVYRRYFPWGAKSKNCYDLVLLCRRCHNSYEREADALKNSLEPDFVSKISNLNQLRKYVGILSMYLKWKDEGKIEYQYLEQKLRKFFGVEELNEETRNKHRLIYEKLEPEVQQGKNVVDNLLEDHKLIQNFVEMWRIHFIETVRPEFMPVGWNIKTNVFKVKNKAETK